MVKSLRTSIIRIDLGPYGIHIGPLLSNCPEQRYVGLTMQPMPYRMCTTFNELLLCQREVKKCHNKIESHRDNVPPAKMIRLLEILGLD